MWFIKKKVRSIFVIVHISSISLGKSENIIYSKFYKLVIHFKIGTNISINMQKIILPDTAMKNGGFRDLLGLRKWENSRYFRIYVDVIFKVSFHVPIHLIFCAFLENMYRQERTVTFGLCVLSRVSGSGFSCCGLGEKMLWNTLKYGLL